MTKQPAVCVPEDTLDVAGRIMREHHCGFVPVVESQTSKRMVGVVTDRDVALYLTRTDQAASHVLVDACMTPRPKTVWAEADLTEAAQIMEEAAVHRLPVVEGERVVGVLSLKDIALAAKKEWMRLGVHVAEQQMKEILEAIAATELAATTRE